ncbi:UNVERIFIED_CONTAM: hypothetical protein FKN15_065153 [Acipenser sinensis]
MVSSYLVHHGYCATAEAFAKSTDQAVHEELASIKNRQKIQKLVLAGRMGEAIETTQQLYPSLEDRNPNLVFMLKVRQFIEMVNGTDSEVRCLGGHSPKSQDSYPGSPRTFSSPSMSPSHSANIHSLTLVKSSGSHGHLAEIDSTQLRRQLCGGSQAAIERMIHFGRELQAMSEQLRRECGKNSTNKKMLKKKSGERKTEPDTNKTEKLYFRHKNKQMSETPPSEPEEKCEAISKLKTEVVLIGSKFEYRKGQGTEHRVKKTGQALQHDGFSGQGTELRVKKTGQALQHDGISGQGTEHRVKKTGQALQHDGISGQGTEHRVKKTGQVLQHDGISGQGTEHRVKKTGQALQHDGISGQGTEHRVKKTGQALQHDGISGQGTEHRVKKTGQALQHDGISGQGTELRVKKTGQALQHDGISGQGTELRVKKTGKALQHNGIC